MLKSLKMTGFRAFESYALDSLSLVNLVVGKNNSGKTSVLEAVDLLVSGGNPAAISESAHRREEVRPVESRPGFRRLPSMTHLFHGHACEPGARFDLRGSRSNGRVTVEIRSLDDFENEVLSRMLDGFDDRLPPEASPAMALAITVNVRKKPEFIFPVTEDGLLLQDVRRLWTRRRSARFLSPSTTEPPFLSQAWNTLVTDGREQEVVDDMKLLMPDIESIHYLPGGRVPRGGGFVVGLRPGGSRYPLGTFGDGMRRLLQLRLALVNNADSCVLVDEIVTGLHWTVMAGMWRLMVEVARKSHLQLFATTHSHDCILGLASMIKSYPDLAAEVSIQKIDTSLPQAVSVQGMDIPAALESGIDFR
ncbi:MAG: AAA family ATPase [Gammaproteobacteria bacterium]|nr:AAA family ATPase [Gammaproteobacteria bacterium]